MAARYVCFAQTARDPKEVAPRIRQNLDRHALIQRIRAVSLEAQWEHTVVVTDDGVEVLTAP